MPKIQAMLQECIKCKGNFASYHELDLCNDCSNAELREQNEARLKREQDLGAIIKLDFIEQEKQMLINKHKSLFPQKKK